MIRVGGAVGDATVINLEEGEFTYDDGNGESVRTDRRIAPVITLKDGIVWKPGEA